MAQSNSCMSLLRNARREAWLTMLVWAAALVWTVGYSYLYGYQHSADSWVMRIGLVRGAAPADFQQVAGMPRWVFWGIFVPWLVCTAWTVLFALRGMQDDDLGAEAEEGASDGH